MSLWFLLDLKTTLNIDVLDSQEQGLIKEICTSLHTGEQYNIASGFMTVKCEAPVRSELDLSALGSQEKKIKRTCCNHSMK